MSLNAPEFKIMGKGEPAQMKLESKEFKPPTSAHLNT